jgi:protein-export membrane protein SecD
MLKTRIIAVFLLIIAVAIGLLTYYQGTFKLGLDLNGGTHLVYKADVSKIPSGDVKVSMQALRDVIERRVNAFGVGEPLIQVEEGGILGSKEAQQKLIVELPGIADAEQAKEMIGITPKLEFKVLTTKSLEELSAKKDLTDEQKEIELQKLYTETGLNGSMVQRATVEFNQNTGEPSVSLKFNAEGKDLFAKITKENVGNYIAIFLDKDLKSQPVVKEEIKDGNAQISGAFSLDEAKLLVRDLNYGALPVPIQWLSTQTVGASLGQSALNGGIRSGIIALIVIALFLIIWYRLPGLVAVLALCVYTILVLAIFKLFSVTLTAAGIAAFILSIGMAVDANILIFERMKEELRKGKGISEAMHEGFTRAWNSIRDSNTSSIITGLILYFSGSTSVVTGFALVFLIGVVVSMFTAITASRIFLYAVAPKKTNRLSTFLISNGFTKTIINPLTK